MRLPVTSTFPLIWLGGGAESTYHVAAAVSPVTARLSLTEQEREIVKLKKALKEVQFERDILKKAVGIFSSTDSKYSGS